MPPSPPEAWLSVFRTVPVMVGLVRACLSGAPALLPWVLRGGRAGGSLTTGGSPKRLPGITSYVLLTPGASPRPRSSLYRHTCCPTGTAGPSMPREPGQSGRLHPGRVREPDRRGPKVQVSGSSGVRRALRPAAGLRLPVLTPTVWAACRDNPEQGHFHSGPLALPSSCRVEGRESCGKCRDAVPRGNAHATWGWKRVRVSGRGGWFP